MALSEKLLSEISHENRGGGGGGGSESPRQMLTQPFPTKFAAEEGMGPLLGWVGCLAGSKFSAARQKQHHLRPTWGHFTSDVRKEFQNFGPAQPFFIISIRVHLLVGQPNPPLPLSVIFECPLGGKILNSRPPLSEVELGHTVG